MSRRAAAPLAALTLLLGGCGGGAGSVGPVAPGPLKVAVGTAPQRGPSDAWVTVIEFSDFQCPYCASAEPQVEALLAALPADVRLLYRHRPLPSLHANAQAAAVAAECAREQGPAPDGHFWALHDALLDQQASWAGLAAGAATARYLVLAGGIAGLDTTAFAACLGSAPPAARVAADAALASSFGINGTPTFVVNGTRVNGAGGLRGAVDGALAWALQSGLPRAQYYERAVLGL